eukprot:CAMPEP_0119268094 /NCGR_PEP_ID=MMETSP1329-20130426/5986_1 /TAXON_ID=114041 /ORGANISM="Genus nov. species nov., Strain RCC1024" /LENGTH=365 /DNA_ID=CAMNT_0007268045 /DNA_START=158 /DNA_END=1251 /DNA_ORIENTATION=+
MRLLLLFHIAHAALSPGAPAARNNWPMRLVDHAWTLQSRYDYTNSSNDVMAVAYPAAVATYYTTLLAAGSAYEFNGTFPTGPGVFQCSLMVYTLAGEPDASVPPRWGIAGDQVREPVAASNRPRWAIQRFYVKPEIYKRADLEAALLEVRRDGDLVPQLGSEARLRNSRAAEDFATLLITSVASTGWPPIPTAFHFNGGNTGGLFPEDSHQYAVAFPVASQSAVISGSFAPTDTYPYLDFSIGDQTTTKVDAALPYYVLTDHYRGNGDGGSYCLEVLAPECPRSDAPAMKWAAGNEQPLLIARLMAYDFATVDYRRTRTPAGTARLLGDMYPNITFAADCSARCPDSVVPGRGDVVPPRLRGSAP